MNDSQAWGHGVSVRPGEVQVLSAQMRTSISSLSPDPRAPEGPLLPTWPSACHKERSVLDHVTTGEAVQASEEAASLEQLISQCWAPELQRKNSILHSEARSRRPPGFLFSGSSIVTVGRDNRGCCPDPEQRRCCRMTSWLSELPAAPAF